MNLNWRNICYIYSMVQRSIPDIYDPRRHIYRGAKRRGKYVAKVVYRGYGPTYRIIYTIYYGECATDKPFAWKCFAKWCHFCPKSIPDICDPLTILKLLWLHNHHGIYIYTMQTSCRCKYGILIFPVTCSQVHLLDLHGCTAGHFSLVYV